MLYKQEKAIDLYERKGYLDYVISEIANLEEKNEETVQPLLNEVDSIINDIIYIAVNLHKDFPDILIDLGIGERNI